MPPFLLVAYPVMVAYLVMATRAVPAAPLANSVPSVPEPPRLHPVVSWIGNSFSGEKGANFVPIQIEDISVGGDGTVATNSGYNEAFASVQTFKDGKYVGQTGHKINGPQHRSTVAEDPENKYLFYACFHADVGTGVGRVSPSGADDPKNVVANCPYAWPGNDLSNHTIVGLSVRNHRLFVADQTSHQIAFYDEETLKRLGDFPCDAPDKLAATHSGDVWLLHRERGAVKYQGRTGAVLATVTLPGASAVCVDVHDRLLVADSAEQNIKIFSPQGKRVGTFGTPGGIFAPPASGVAGAGRFENPQGIGVDNQNNLYVLSVGAIWPAVNRIESYAPMGDTWGGAARWQVIGMMFGDLAAFDPTDENILYTSCARLKMDWSKPGNGKEWSYAATTLNVRRFGQDARINIFTQGGAARSALRVQKVGNEKWLYSGVNNVEITRLATGADTTVGVPGAYVATRRTSIDWANAGWPPNLPVKGDAGWIWRDKNRNGAFDADEFYEFSPVGNSDLQVDTRGDLWYFPNRGEHPLARHLLLPQWTQETLALPTGYERLCFVQPEAATGDLFALVKRPGEPDYALARFANWRTLQAAATVTWVVPHAGGKVRSEVWIPKPTDCGAIAVAGDYVFVAAAIHNSVTVYRKTTGVLVGRMETSLSQNTTLDNPHGFAVQRRKNGEYDLILMDFLHNKNLLYRWTPVSP